MYVDGNTGRVIINPIEITNGGPIEPLEFTEKGEAIRPLEILPIVVKKVDAKMIYTPTAPYYPQNVVPIVKEAAEKLEVSMVQQDKKTAIIFKDEFSWEKGMLQWHPESQKDSIVIGNFQVEIDEEVYEVSPKDEDGKEEKKLMLYCHIRTGEGKKYGDKVLAEKFSDFSWIKKATEGNAYLETEPQSKKGFLAYMRQQRSKTVRTKYHYLTNGWKTLEGGRRGYVVDTGVIGSKDLPVTGDNKRKFGTKTRGNLSSLQLVAEVLGQRRILVSEWKMAPMIILPHLGVMASMFEEAGYPIKFVTGLFGATNSRKTSIALATSRIFNRDDLSTPDISFSSTAGGLEKKMAWCGDAVLLIDDKHPTENRAEKNTQDAKYNAIMRAYGDNVTKERMLDFTTAKNVFYRPSGVCCITGEVTSGVESTRSRMVMVEIDKRDCCLEALSYYQQRPWILTDHLESFIIFLTERYDSTVEKIRNDVPAFRKTYQQSFYTGRYAETMAVYETALAILGQYASQVGMLADTWEQEYTFLKESLMSVLRENDIGLLESDPGVMFLKATKELLDSADVTVVNIPKDKKICGTPDSIYVTDQFVFLKLERALKVAMNYCKQHGRNYPLQSGKEILPFLEGLEVIDIQGGRRTRKMTSYVKSQDRFLTLKKERIQQVIAEQEERV